MTERVTAYLCRGEGGSVPITVHDSDINVISITSISEGTSQVTVAIQPSPIPAGCAIETGKITTYIIEPGQSKYCVQSNGETGKCGVEAGELEWYRGYTFGELNFYININADSPDHCHWIRTEIWLNIGEIGPRPGAELWGYSEVSSGGGVIPDDKADVFSGGSTAMWTSSDNLIVPGDLLTLFHRLDDGESQEVIPVDSTWWCCCCFTGGEITEIDGETYLVECQSVERFCIRSDWTEYEVGDWVFVAALQGGCLSCGRTAACKQLCGEEEPDQEVEWVILPLTIGGYGP